MPSSHVPFNTGSMLSVIYKYLFFAISLSFTLISQFNNNECLSGFFRFIASEYENCYKCNSRFILSQLRWNIKCIRVSIHISMMSNEYTIAERKYWTNVPERLKECHTIRKKTVSFNENANFLCESNSNCSVQWMGNPSHIGEKKLTSVWLDRCKKNWHIYLANEWWTVDG